MYIDSHAHLTMPPAFDHVEEMLERAKQQGISKIVNICVDEQGLERGLVLAKRHPWIYNTAATTPHDVEKKGVHFFPLVYKAAKEKKLVAIGETGLDYYHKYTPPQAQKESLLQYFALAKETALPLIFHCRDAFQDLFALADEYAIGSSCVLHCFTGNLEEAKQCLNRGWYISFSGILTFNKSQQLRSVVEYVPLQSILVETDTPYLAPQSKRGKMNEPSFLPEVVEVLSHIKKIEPGQVAFQTSMNASAFFSFPKES